MAGPKTQKYKATFDPDEEKDFGRTWQDRLADDELIRTSVWIITCEDEATPTLIESSQGTGISDDFKSTSIFLIGGTNELEYKLTNRITTMDDNGDTRKYDKSGLLTVAEA